MDQEGAEKPDSNTESSETAPLLVEEVESHVQPVISTAEASAGNVRPALV